MMAGIAANSMVYLRPNLSMDHAVGMGPAMEASTRIDTIHELSSGVMGSGESLASSIGSVGDVQPYDAITESVRRVTGRGSNKQLISAE